MRVHRFECGLPPQKLITGKTHRRIEKDFFLSTIKKQRERNQKGKDMKIRQINSGIRTSNRSFKKRWKK